MPRCPWSVSAPFRLHEPTMKLTNQRQGKPMFLLVPRAGTAPHCPSPLLHARNAYAPLFVSAALHRARQPGPQGRRVPRNPHGLPAPLARLCPALGPAGGAAGPPRGCGHRAGPGGGSRRRGRVVRWGHLGRDGSYSPGGFTAAGVAILSLRRIKTNARGAEGCSEQPGGSAGGAGSRRQGGRAGRRGGGGCSRPGTGGAARSVRGGPRCPMAPRRLCSCAALSEHVPGGRTCALGPRSPLPGRDPPQERAGAAFDTAPDRPPPSGLEPAAPGRELP